MYGDVIEKGNQTKESAIWLICLSAPMAQKSKKAKPDDHETNNSAIRLIGAKLAFGSHEAKKQKAKTCDHETNDSAIRFIGLLAPMEQKSKKRKAK